MRPPAVVRVKDNTVKFDTIGPAGFFILAMLWRLTGTRPPGRDVVISSGTDFHQLPDPHARGEAYDVSVEGRSPEDIREDFEDLHAWCAPQGVTVLFEVPPSYVLTDETRPIATVNPHATGAHFHLQVAIGTTWN